MPAVRLQKLLSSAGLTSRRKAEEWIAAGRVLVNGDIVTELGTRADPAVDQVVVDGVRVELPTRRTYLLLYKPRGYVSALSDPQRRRTIRDLLPPDCPRVFHVGRLDYQTEGLLLLTDDGDFAERVAHPRYGCPKVYVAKVRGVPSGDVIGKLRRGIVLDGKRTAPARVDIVHSTRRDGNTWISLTLREGRSREIRRMLETVGHEVSKLRRIKIGVLDAKGLAPGACRELKRSEVEALRKGPELEDVQRPRPTARANSRLPKSEMKRIKPPPPTRKKRTGAPPTGGRGSTARRPAPRPPARKKPRAGGRRPSTRP